MGMFTDPDFDWPTAIYYATRAGVGLRSDGSVIHPDCFCCKRTRGQARDVHERLLIETMGYCQRCYDERHYNRPRDERCRRPC